MKYAVSRDGELYHGEFSSIEEAKTEASLNGWGKYFVGECDVPVQPESWWKYWDESTKEQREELEEEVRNVMSAWLDRHGLRPRFCNIVNPIEFEAATSESAEPK